MPRSESALAGRCDFPAAVAGVPSYHRTGADRTEGFRSRFTCDCCQVLGRFDSTAKHHRTFSPWPPKSAIVEAVAHLPIVMMESYALKELSEAEMLRVEKHVARCPKCRDHLDEELGWAAAMRSPFKRYVEKLIEAERKKAAKR